MDNNEKKVWDEPVLIRHDIEETLGGVNASDTESTPYTNDSLPTS